MKIGLITYGLDRPLGGISRYTLELMRALPAQMDLTLLSAGDQGVPVNGTGYRSASLPGCRLLPGLITLGNLIIPPLSRRLSLDAIHDPTGVTPFLLGAGRAKTVVTVHDVFPWSCPGTSTLLDTLIYRHWLPRVLPRVDAVVTVSRASKADISRYLSVPAARIHVIYQGVNPRYRPAPPTEREAVRRRYQLPPGYILFLGSVERRKNLRRLLAAYAQLRASGERRALVIAGLKRRKYTPVQVALQDLGLEENVVFTGYVADDELPALYGSADLFVFPSLYEGFGLPPLEAMACGTPVVTSNVSSLPEVVGDAALTVDPYDVTELATGMQRGLNDGDLRAKLREKGLERARQFTWQRTARETIAVYRRVCGQQLNVALGQKENLDWGETL